MLRIKTMKQFIKIFLSSLLIAVILTPLKSGRIMYGELSAFSISSFIGAIIISIWTIFCLNKYEGKLKIAYVLISILAGISFLDLLFFLTQITHFKSALLSLPTLIIWDLGIFAGWVLFYGKTNTARIAYALISLLVCYILSVPVYDAFTKKVKFNAMGYNRILKPVIFSTPTNEKIDLSEFEGRYIILLFWDACSSKDQNILSDLQILYDKIKTEKDVSLYAVYVWTPNENKLAIIDEISHSFPCLYTARNGYTTTILGVTKYPTMLILNKKSEIIYNGKFTLNALSCIK